MGVRPVLSFMGDCCFAGARGTTGVLVCVFVFVCDDTKI